jgi:hypothetical protein
MRACVRACMRSLLLSPDSRARFVVRFYRILRARVINSAGFKEKTSVLFFLGRVPRFARKSCLAISSIIYLLASFFFFVFALAQCVINNINITLQHSQNFSLSLSLFLSLNYHSYIIINGYLSTRCESSYASAGDTKRRRRKGEDIGQTSLDAAFYRERFFARTYVWDDFAVNHNAATFV